MTAAISAWLVVTGLLGVLALLAIWSRRPTRIRALSVAAFLVASPVAAAALGVALGWPVPLVSGVNAPAGQYVVLGAKMIVGKGIYVLIDVGGVPRYYTMPWDKKKAEQLQDSINRAGKDGTVTMDVPPFEWSWDTHETFNALPQPQVLPPKPQQERPLNYDRSI